MGLLEIVEESNNTVMLRYNPLELSRSIVASTLLLLFENQDEMQRIAFRQVS